jgi:hypothetical protein
LDTGEGSMKKQKWFYFENQWLLEEDFKGRFQKVWQDLRGDHGECKYSMVKWHGCLSKSRQYLRGWQANKQAEQRKRKQEILCQLKKLDKIYEEKSSVEAKWVERYKLEEQLEHIYTMEEMYWQQRSSEQWLLKGDANTSYFHACANGKRRKTRICSLNSDQGEICGQEEISKHIVEFYKNLFGSGCSKGVHLNLDFWTEEEKMGEEDRKKLELPFMEKVVVAAITGMRSELAPGPNDFTVTFFKRLWPIIKDEVMRMMQDFNNNTLDLKRLNYGVITLVPKVKEANTIRQFRPIWLLNVDFKIFPKVLNDRLTPMVGKLISGSQTTFMMSYPGSNNRIEVSIRVSKIFKSHIRPTIW